jgi:hypothetical protein
MLNGVPATGGTVKTTACTNNGCLSPAIERQIAGRTADLLGRRTIIFGIAPCEQHTGTTGRLELGFQGNIAGETQSPTALAGRGKIRLSFRGGPSGPNAEPRNTGQALVSQAGVHGFRVPSLRSGPGMTAIWAFFSGLL